MAAEIRHNNKHKLVK